MESKCLLFSDDPIIACSTGNVTSSAIAIIRISGFKALENFQEVFDVDLRKVKPKCAKSFRLYDGHDLVDDGVLIYFKSPKSYNGENILELNVHGNQLNVSRIIELFKNKFGIRVAHAGEFTYRALKNRKLSLSQVEGLDLFLNANSKYMLSQGQAILHGQLNRTYSELHTFFINLKASLELSIDFADDVGEEVATSQLENSFNKFKSLIDTLFLKTKNFKSELLNPSIVLVGAPNAGKSTLFNQLLNTSRSIVSPMAGTTRDFVSEYLYFKDTHFRLVDTAGIRNSHDTIEAQGVKKSLELMESAFFKILVVNPHTIASDASFINGLENQKFDLVVWTFTDQAFSEKARVTARTYIPKVEHEILIGLKADGPIGPLSYNLFGPIGPKSKTGGSIGPEKIWNGPIGPQGNGGGPIEPVTMAIVELAFMKYENLMSEGPLLIERHRQVIENIWETSQSFHHLLKNEEDIGILSSELNLLGQLVQELIGIVTPDEVLNSIFSRFCIGK